jgi:hypothetical protein
MAISNLEGTNTSTKPKGISYSVYVGDKHVHVGHLNFNEFVTADKAQQIVDKLAVDGIFNVILNDGSSSKNKLLSLEEALA